MRKVSSPKYIALIASLVAALISSISIGVFTQEFIPAILNFIVVLTLCFFIFNYLVREFIYDKIKLIYRSIYRFKTHDPKELKALDKKLNDPIEAVSKEVLSWMVENRKEVAELKEQENYRRDFLGNVSHELKTPIHNIQGYIHTLLDGALNDESVNQLFLSKAAKSSDRLVELVNDLTRIGHLEGESSLTIEKIDLVKLAHEVLEMVEQQAQEKEIKIKFKKQNARIVTVQADRARIRQVMVNLMVNAIKYGKKGGKVTVGFYDLDQNILTEITDNGEGIAEEHLSRLFERFYRTDRGRSRNEGGSGLGLAIVKHIIEAHKQTINVRSTVGVGSTFGFTLKKG
ncbi:MAG: two-component sensor histidine kinase [Bacteroidetes bacterium]|nr:MAG: two-component sensor histidine kinase [Bacteroidota bacterium]